MIRRLFPTKPAPATEPEPPPTPRHLGRLDGVADGVLFGWAWTPAEPGERARVEQWVDGAFKAACVADIHRNDLQEAGIGDGAHGWRMLLAADIPTATPRRIELRFADGTLLQRGVHDHLPPEPAPPPDPALAPWPEEAELQGWGQCDGIVGANIQGWAWHPGFPELHVVVEQWVDGKLAAETVATGFRADLKAAGLGLGRYGWSMKLAVDRAEQRLRRVEIRVRGAGLLPGGRLIVSGADLPEPAAEAEPAAPSDIGGRCDGLKGAALYGWAWRPRQPDAVVEVEMWIDGACAARATADQFRPDLRANLVGTGRYGWRLPVDMARLREGPLRVEIRADGVVLDNGALELTQALGLDDPANADLRPFVEAVLFGAAVPPAAPARALTCLAWCPPPAEAGRFWSREYDDYPAARAAFMPAFAQLGEALAVESLEEAAAIARSRREQGGECVLFAFGSPRTLPVALPCPVVPVFAWAFPTIPTASTDGDPRCDWRNVLRFAGRAVALSRFARDAARAAMGADFPIVAIPPPVARKPLALAPLGPRRLSLPGVVFDTRNYVFRPDQPAMPTRVWTGGADGAEVTVEGVLTVAFLDLDDQRKNWADMVGAYATANRHQSDATLLLVLSEPSAAWMTEIYKRLAAQMTFQCRIIAVRGALAEPATTHVIAAAHWWASGSSAEGLCVHLQDFLAAGRPAVAPRHTALADHITDENALTVFADEEDWRWPGDPEDGLWSWTQHPDDVGLTTRFRVSWADQVRAFTEAHRLATLEPASYARLSDAAARRGVTAGGADAAADALRGLLAVRPAPPDHLASPSALLRGLAEQ